MYLQIHWIHITAMSCLLGSMNPYRQTSPRWSKYAQVSVFSTVNCDVGTVYICVYSCVEIGLCCHAFWHFLTVLRTSLSTNTMQICGTPFCLEEQHMLQKQLKHWQEKLWDKNNHLLMWLFFVLKKSQFSLFVTSFFYMLIWGMYLYGYVGAAYCQLMDWLFPGSLDLSIVRFQSSMILDSLHNFRLLQAAFHKVGVVRVSIVTNAVKPSNIVLLKMQSIDRFVQQSRN